MDGLGSLALFVLACAAAAATGIVFRPGDWYRRLDKPAWRPPDRVFGPVWAVLYLMIAVAGWLIWREAGMTAALPLAVYFGQLVLNGLWSALFFGLHRPGLALAEIVLLWLAVAATAILFHPVEPWAAYLLVPYLAWVGFAVALNASVWRRNRHA